MNCIIIHKDNNIEEYNFSYNDANPYAVWDTLSSITGKFGYFCTIPKFPFKIDNCQYLMMYDDYFSSDEDIEDLKNNYNNIASILTQSIHYGTCLICRVNDLYVESDYNAVFEIMSKDEINNIKAYLESIKNSLDKNK